MSNPEPHVVDDYAPIRKAALEMLFEDPDFRWALTVMCAKRFFVGLFVGLIVGTFIGKVLL